MFMFQHVAMKNKAASKAFESSDDCEHFSWVDDRRILPSGLV
jgi:hypothetical protein